MRPMFIVDLDDNLGQALRKCPPGVRPLSVMSVDREGEPQGFMTPKQMAFFTHLNSSGDVVPCTGRDRAGLNRMRLPFTGHAIVSFGGAIIKPDGSFERRWMRHIREAAAGVSTKLEDLVSHAKGLSGGKGWDIRCELIGEHFTDELTPLFVQMKHRSVKLADLDALQEALTPEVPEGWKIHRNENTLAFMPPFLRKGLAVKFFLQNIAATPLFVVGMGDSIDDGGFMGLCDYALMPTGSQIFGLIRKEVTDVPR